MKTCSTCGSGIAPGDDFCTSCGTRQAAIPPGPPESRADPLPPPPVARPGNGAGREEFRDIPESAVAAAAHAAGTTDDLPGLASPGPSYMGQRMMYEKDNQRLESLDPLGSNRYRSELFFHFILIGFIWWLGFIVIAGAAVVLSLINRGFGTVTFFLAAVGWSIAMACAFWLHKLPGQLSEWKFAVDDKGGAAPIAFNHVAWAFSRRNTPVDFCRIRRFPVMGQGSRDVLEVRQGIFYGLVSCFASGNDLYIGWTFWLYLSPARWLLIYLRRFLWECRFQGHAIYVSLQFDRAKALREAIHSAVREGVDVAVGQVSAQGQGAVGSLVPVVADDSTNDPAWQWSGTTGEKG